MDKSCSYTVVVVEDEELILNNIVKKVQEADLGFVVIHAATDGKTALEAVEQRPPDVIITDIRMPVMDGLELLKVISTSYPYIKKIVISGHDDFAFAQQAIKYDVTDYLLKPLKMGDLSAALTRIRITIEKEKSTTQQNRLSIDSHHEYSAEDIVKTVELYIKENYSCDINFDKIAKEYSFSSAYLSKIFSKYVGMNPCKYLILLRINKAKHLLLSEQEISIKEVGERVGYPDQFYFSKIFKSITGMSPVLFKSSCTSRTLPLRE